MNFSLIKKITLSAISILIIAACAGKTPYPVPQRQPGDEYLSCLQINQQIFDNQAKVMQLIPQQNKTGKNVGLGIAGAIFLVPWFFMDFSDAERIEIESYRLRENALQGLYSKKKCDSALNVDN